MGAPGRNAAHADPEGRRGDAVTCRDVVIIGGGHNGLIAAFYLAQGRVQAARPRARATVVGGCAATEEIAPGFRCPTLAHAIGPLRPSVVARHAARASGSSSCGPTRGWSRSSPTGGALVVLDRRRTDGRSDPAVLAERTRRAIRSSARRCSGSAAFLAARCWSRRRRRLDAPGGRRDVGAAEDRPALPRARQAGRLPAAALGTDGGRRSRRRVVRDRSAAGGDRGARDLRHGAGPWSAGTGAVLLLNAAADPAPGGSSVTVKGGPARWPRAHGRRRARTPGAEIRTGARVARIVDARRQGGRRRARRRRRDRGAGGRLERGSEPHVPRRSSIRSSSIRRSCTQGSQLPDAAARVAKVNLALGGLPAFRRRRRTRPTCTAGSTSARASTTSSGLRRVEVRRDLAPSRTSTSRSRRCSIRRWRRRASTSCRSTCSSRPTSSRGRRRGPRPASARDHRGANAGAIRARHLRNLIEAHAGPDAASISSGPTGSPADTSYHGEPSLDQLFTMRPILGWAQYPHADRRTVPLRLRHAPGRRHHRRCPARTPRARSAKTLQR